MSQDKSPIPENAQDSEAPEGKNRSQRDEARQAQTVSEQAAPPRATMIRPAIPARSIRRTRRILSIT